MNRRRALSALAGLVPAALGLVLWRLDRDQPLWRHPTARNAPGPAGDTAASAPLPRLVLAFHYPWYGTPTGPAGAWRHWNHARIAMPGGEIRGRHDPRHFLDAGRRDVGATDYPLDGPYDSADRSVIRRQIADARSAGLDGFVVSWWGRESREARVFERMLDALPRVDGFVLAPYYETGELWPRGADGVAADLLELMALSRRHPPWLTVAARPVVFLYAAHRLRAAAWDLVVRRLRDAGHHPYLVTDSPGPDWLARQPGWLVRFDALHLYSPVVLQARGTTSLEAALRARAQAAGAAGRPFMAPVSPGFDDRIIRTPGTVVPREAGRTYDLSWRAALAAEPAWVLVSSWNEWHEGSEIEPSQEHGRRYLEATRAWADRFRGER